MRKLSFRLDTEIRRHRSAPPWRTVVAIALIALALPLVWEEALVCCANWLLMMGGPSYVVETPRLDAAQALVLGVLHACRCQVDSFCSRLPWEPMMVIVFGVSIAVFMSFPLRRPW